MLDVAVIGCGIVGANVAYLLSQHKLRAAVFEKENDVSMGTTRANSAIVHAGYDPEPGTAMARLNVRGSALTKEQCAAFDVKYRQIGSLVLAFSDEEMATVRRLYENGVANGVPGVRVLTREDGVIATGGGIVTRAENIRMMREKGFVVWLCRPLEDMIADVRQDTRPNLAGDKAERMRTLYGRRERLYAAAAHLSFDNRMPPEESAKALQKLLTE